MWSRDQQLQGAYWQRKVSRGKNFGINRPFSLVHFVFSIQITRWYSGDFIFAMQALICLHVFILMNKTTISFPELLSPWPAAVKRELWEHPFEITIGNNRSLVIRFTEQSRSAFMARYGACLKWLLSKLSFSNFWSRGTKLWERDWQDKGSNLLSIVICIGKTKYTCKQKRSIKGGATVFFQILHS